MKERFIDYIKYTKVFFLVRLIVTFAISVIYILIAAGIQYLFVRVFGESTFNYLVGGIISLIAGIVFCKYIGSLLFMFAKSWHSCAIAYVKAIKEKDLSALDIGIRVFNKHIVSFGVMYVIRQVTESLLSSCMNKLYDLLKDVPMAQVFKKASTNPIVEYIAKDMLHFGFDAAIFYLITHPAKDSDKGDISSVIIDGVKKYLYCLPSIMLSSLSMYLIFGVLPKIAAMLSILFCLFVNGLASGIALVVLLFPIFYILEHSLFEPISMMIFLACYSSKCDDSNVSEDVKKIVASILTDQNLPTEHSDSSDLEEEEENEDDSEPVIKTSPPPIAEPDSKSERRRIPTTLEDLAQMSGAGRASMADITPGIPQVELRADSPRSRRVRQGTSPDTLHDMLRNLGGIEIDSLDSKDDQDADDTISQDDTLEVFRDLGDPLHNLMNRFGAIRDLGDVDLNEDPLQGDDDDDED